MVYNYVVFFNIENILKLLFKYLTLKDVIALSDTNKEIWHSKKYLFNLFVKYKYAYLYCDKINKKLVAHSHSNLYKINEVYALTYY